MNLACPACERTGRVVGEKDGFTLARCPCGTLFIPDRAPDAFDYLSGAGCQYDYVAPEVSMRSLSELVEAASQYRKLNTWLDMGYGRGELLDVAARRGWEVYGTELAEHSLRLGKEAGWHVATGTNDMTSASFDVVSMNGFIEHLIHPDDSLRDAKRLLRPGGLLWISTPNGRCLNARLLGLDWAAVEPPQHTIIWSTSGMRAALRRTGFTIRAIQCTGLSPYAVMLKLRGGRREGADHDRMDARINAAVSRTKPLKSAINGVLSLVRLGDTMKVWATTADA